MSHRTETNQGSKTGARLLWLGAVVAIVSLATHSAVAAKGNPQSAVTITFDDLVGDAIQSDGLGPYAGSINSRDGSLTMSTGDGALYFDFSMNITPEAFSPFGPGVDSGLISDVTMKVAWGLDGAPDTAAFVYVVFEFVAPAPDGSGPTDWQLGGYMGVSFEDRSGDGETDTYVLARAEPFNYATLVWRTEPVREPSTGPRRGPRYKDDGWRAAGQFDMLWGAFVER